MFGFILKGCKFSVGGVETSKMQKILRNRLAKKTFIGARLKKIKRQKTLFHKQIKYGRLFGTTKIFPLFDSIQLGYSTHLPEMQKKRDKSSNKSCYVDDDDDDGL